MRSALASIEGIEESDVEIDYDAKTATIRAPENVDAKALVAAFQDTRFTAQLKDEG